MRTPLVLLAFLAAACSAQKSGPEKASSSSAAAAAAATPVAPNGRRVNVRVSRDGYEPDRIEVKAKEDVTLVFTRVDEAGCANEIVFPSLGIKKPLPLNQPVPVDFHGEKPGEVKFACGMDMLHGMVVVKD